MLSMKTLSFLAGRRKPAVRVTLLFLLFLVGATPTGWAQQAAALQEDDRVGPAELFQLQLQWQVEDPVIDQNYDKVVDEDDVLILHSLWHEKETFQNPYTKGRAAGIYAVTEHNGEKFISDEMEVQIADSTADFKPRVAEGQPLGLNKIDSGRRKVSAPPSAEKVFDPAALAADPELFAELMMRLRGCEDPYQGASKVGSSAQTPQLGVASEQIGTFWGWTVWLGWDASWSETYLPEGESYAMVLYFAPEGIYFALQRGEFVYSGVDVFAGVGTFMGAAAFPGEQYFRKDSLGKNVTVSLSYGMGLIPTFSFAPTVSLSHGITFFRENNTPQHAIQLGVGSSVSLSLLPISLPASVSLGTSPPCEKDPIADCGIYVGFYPIILWAPAGPEGGSPLEKIITGLEELSVLPGNDFPSTIARELANTLLPIFYHLYTPEWVTLEDDVPPPSNSHYFTEFLQDPNPSSSSNTSINHLIDEVGQWLDSGETSGLGEAIQDQIQVDGPLFYEYAKSLEAGTKMGQDINEKRVYDRLVAEGAREDNKIFVEGIETVPCPVGDSCAVVISATEIAELFPGSRSEDLEGAWVRFERSALSYLDLGGDVYGWAQIENGLAVYEFVLTSNAPVLIGSFIHKDDNPVGDKHVELRRRKVVPADRTILYSSDKALTGTPTTFRCAALDENGIPLTEGATVRFYDYRDMLIATGVQTKDKLVSVEALLKPSIPRVDDVQTTEVGYTEEDTTTGFSLDGRGFSVAADLLIDGVSINTMSHWEWAVLSSKNILARPVEEQYRLTQTSTIQVVNPEGISSNVYVYTP